MKPSGAGFVCRRIGRGIAHPPRPVVEGYVWHRLVAPLLHRHLAAVRERVGAPAEDRRRARELRRGLPRVEPHVVHGFVRPLRHNAAKRGMAIFSRHGDDAVAVRVVERLLISRALVLGLFHSIRPPSPATAEPHHWSKL